MSERFAFSIRDACRFSGIGRTSLFEMILGPGSFEFGTWAGKF